MSTGILGRRLVLAAIGAASVAALIVMLQQQRRRRQQKKQTVKKSDFNQEEQEDQVQVVPIPLKESSTTNNTSTHPSTAQQKAAEDRKMPGVAQTEKPLIKREIPVVAVQPADDSTTDSNTSTDSETKPHMNASGDAKEKRADEENDELYVEVNASKDSIKQKSSAIEAKSQTAKLNGHVPNGKPLTKNDSSPQKQTVTALTQLPTENGYKNAESPSGTSTNSEGSADSGRATGGPNCSPCDQQNDYDDVLPVYEFEVPNTLVGLIIGVQGKTISELCSRAQVRMLIRPHHTPNRFETHQICSIEGRRNQINKCLHMIRYRFPQHRFPDLNLKPVMPPTIMDLSPQINSEPSALSLPVGVPCEVFVCNVVDAGHFFVQLPTHPTFSSLHTLDYFTMNIYSNLMGIPVLPKPCAPGIVCIAPTCNGWFRAVTLHYDDKEDTVMVRFADYGGFATLPRTELRQIRSDLTSLPMQAVECYLAHVQPVDGTSRWAESALTSFNKLCANKILQAELVGYNKENSIPYVELYTVDENKKGKRMDQILMDMGVAKPSDPTKRISALPNGTSKNINTSTTTSVTAIKNGTSWKR